ncbi:MAG TPA: hypothetical protein VFE58_03940 [Tepidisphaeraceae bacterium]|nr:hypothetical protein [Tepidisphaeraceae bacterium]
MDDVMEQRQAIDVCRQDENGVDLEQLEYNFSLTPAERMQQHYRWRLFVKQVREGAGRDNGSAAGDFEKAE